MSVVIAPLPHRQLPEAAALALAEEHGIAPLLIALRRDITLAEWANNVEDLAYWKAVQAAVLSNVNAAKWPKALDLPVNADPDEGLRLNKIFACISNRQSRDAVITLAEALLRQEPIG